MCILQKAIKIYNLCHFMYFEKMAVKEKHKTEKKIL